MSYRVVIPTAGIGSRLGNLTRYVNKSLVSIAHRPTLSHLIEQFPEECEFVIALGHKGGLVRDFLELAYPERKFYFAKVDPYEGVGSGLGHSLLCCEKYLQEPFVFLSCDTLVKETIPSPDQNWMGYASLEELSLYRTLEVSRQKVNGIYEKGNLGEPGLQAYIGLAGVYDYTMFWDAMRQGKEAAVDQGEAYGLRAILSEKTIEAQEFTWFDTGSPKALESTRAAYREVDEPNILEKENEAIWFVGNRVIKFSADTRFIQNRVHRVEKLKGFVPEILGSREHMYCYGKVEGRVLSDAISLPLFEQLLEHCQIFWNTAALTPNEHEDFQQKCHKFYHDKTIERVDLFFSNFERQDRTESINGESMPTLSELFTRINWEDLTNGWPGRFHGDFHFENILWNQTANRFTFLDWRQDFGGDLEVGDIYYDLAKLLHGLIVSHELIAKEHFSVRWQDDEIWFDLHRKQSLVECEKSFNKWCVEQNISLRKVRILTALIYLNIAALHHYPYSLLLYALGKRMLKHELEEI